MMKKYVKPSPNPSFIHLSSPTFSYESHTKWGSNHCRALLGAHDKIPPEVCGTVGFNGGDKFLISLFLKKYTEKMSYQRRKQPDKYKSALFGVFHIREHDDLIHMHWIARNFEIIYLDELVNKFNKKHGSRFEIMYYAMIESPDSISAYPFKFAEKIRLIFMKGSLSRYVYHVGNYFFGMKKKLEREGFVEFIYNKAIRNFDENILCCAEDFI
jgi:hypothetical protein